MGDKIVKKIIIVEDEINIAKLIKETLDLKNYMSMIAFDGKEALEIIEKENISLVILDVMIPEINGFEVMEKVRDKKIPVIFLSARTEVENVVKGLKLGAQDYIKKPFEPLELLTRVEMVLERFQHNDTTFHFRNITLDTEKRIVSMDEQEVELTLKEFELLELLIKNVNIALSRDQILDKVWGITVDIETRTVDYHIQQLRRKLNLKENIITINKIGYRLEES